MKATAFIGFGANLGDTTETFSCAAYEISLLPQTIFSNSSGLYETKPVDLIDDGPAFSNAVFEIETSLEPQSLIQELRRIEKKLGKSKDHQSNLSRKIDLDLLIYGTVIISTPDLTIPHPRMHLRAFVLIPFFDVAPDYQHPKLKKTIRELLENIPEFDQNDVKLIANMDHIQCGSD